jgi:hypothetical protein
VRVERNAVDGGWIYPVRVCASTTLYWWLPNRWEDNPSGDPVRVRRSGNTLYKYETAGACPQGRVDHQLR